MKASDRYLRRSEVEARLGVTRSTLYRWMRDGEGFPEPIQLGPRAVRWRESEVEAFLAARPRANGMVEGGAQAA